MTRNPTLPMQATEVVRRVCSTRLLSPLPEGYRLHQLPEHVRACDGNQAQVTLSPPLQRGYHGWGIVSSVSPSGTYPDPGEGVPLSVVTILPFPPPRGRVQP